MNRVNMVLNLGFTPSETVYHDNADILNSCVPRRMGNTLALEVWSEYFVEQGAKIRFEGFVPKLDPLPEQSDDPDVVFIDDFTDEQVVQYKAAYPNARIIGLRTPS